MTNAPPHPPDEQPPRQARASGTTLAWLGLIVALGLVWWWFGQSEPLAPGLPESEPAPGALAARSNAASSDWADNLQGREMAAVAARRTQAVRERLQRQVLGPARPHHSDRASTPAKGQIPSPAVTDAGATSP